MKKFNVTKGREGEKEAKEYLERKGFALMEANYNCDVGEIDLIMTDSDWLVFVEVKYKADDKMGLPQEMIDKRKLAQVKRVAQWYLRENQETEKKYQKYRVDAVCILGSKIDHYQNLE